MDNEYAKKRAVDELPQSGKGKTIMTTEPKFIPQDAVTISLDDGSAVKVRLVDCVGFTVGDAVGYLEEDGERMVKTPWFDEDIPFEEAAVVGTKKVIEEHSTVAVLVTTDGSIGDIKRQSYEAAERETVMQLEASGKPFVIVVNTTKPFAAETRLLCESLSREYKAAAIPIDCEKLCMGQITDIMEKLLYEFAVTRVDYDIPKWVQLLPYDNHVKQAVITYAKTFLARASKLSDLGAQTYLDVLSEDNASRLMDDATTALVKLQKNSKRGVLPEYSEELLRRELELFPEWYVKRHLNMEITPQMRSMFDKMFDLIIKKNLAQSFVYVHRDYMPRNLMLEEKDNPGVIDFQDAVYGPVSYDIACLCRDAFISWSEAQVLDWTIRYWDKARKVGIPVPADFGVFWEDVEWMALQRHLKVLGIFARLNYRDGKTKYLGDTPRFLNYVQKTASRFDALRPLSRFINQISGIEETVGYSF